MTSLSITSERFITLHEQVKPGLEAAATPTGFQARVRVSMPECDPRQVLEILAGVRMVAERGIKLAGPDASQVVLDGQAIQRLEWALAGDFD